MDRRRMGMTDENCFRLGKYPPLVTSTSGDNCVLFIKIKVNNNNDSNNKI